MTQFNPLAVNAFPERSNRRLECFNGTPSGEYAQRSNLAAWPLPQPGNVEQCAKFFDADGSSGLPLSRFSSRLSLPRGFCSSQVERARIEAETAATRVL